MFLLILYHGKDINYDLSDCLHASVTELRHICIGKRWGSKLPLMKDAKTNINKLDYEQEHNYEQARSAKRVSTDYTLKI